MVSYSRFLDKPELDLKVTLVTTSMTFVYASGNIANFLSLLSILDTSKVIFFLHGPKVL